MNQKNYILARDVAENAKLNHEISEELSKFKTNHQLSSSGLTRVSRWLRKPCLTWIPVSGTGMTRIFCLTVFMLLPTLAQAETCTPTPDCKTLGYTESSCPDGGGVKCPWNTSLMYCCKKCEEQPPCMSCYVGWILNSDMTCSAEKASGKTPIGVVANQKVTSGDAAVKCVGMAVALKDISSSTSYSDGFSQCSSYSASGVNGWHLPSKAELLTIHNNISSVQSGLTKAGGTQFRSGLYWSSSVSSNPWCVNPVSGATDDSANFGNSYYVRPVLYISWEGQL